MSETEWIPEKSSRLDDEPPPRLTLPVISFLCYYLKLESPPRPAVAAQRAATNPITRFSIFFLPSCSSIGIHPQDTEDLANQQNAGVTNQNFDVPEDTSNLSSIDETPHTGHAYTVRAAKKITKEYVIDLSLPEEQRWAHVIKKEKRAAKTLVANAQADFPEVTIKWLAGAFAAAYKWFGGYYVAELEAWARCIRCSSKELLLLNCSYELAHADHHRQAAWEAFLGAYEWVVERASSIPPLGCTAGVLRADKSKAVLVRNMDWPIKGLGKATRIFRFVGNSHEFVTVGVLGLVGVLSGMVPGAYAATLNFAPPTLVPFFSGFGPLFLLRHVFENCATYDEAVEMLSETKLAANVIFTVAAADGRSCSVERTRGKFVIRPSRGGRVAVANHFQAEALKPLNKKWDTEIISDSSDRSQTLLRGLKGMGASPTSRQLKSLLDREPVLNDETCQQMIFDPARGKLTVWGR